MRKANQCKIQTENMKNTMKLICSLHLGFPHTQHVWYCFWKCFIENISKYKMQCFVMCAGTHQYWQLNLHNIFWIKRLDAWVHTVEFCIILINWIEKTKSWSSLFTVFSSLQEGIHSAPGKDKSYWKLMINSNVGVNFTFTLSTRWCL